MSAIAAKAASAAGTVTETADAVTKVRGRRGRRARKGIGPAPDRALIAAITVLFGTGFLRAALVDKSLPDRQWWVGTTVVAALLSLGTDMAPKGARYISYAVILGAVMANTIPIFGELTKLDKASTDGTGGTDSGTGAGATTLAASGLNSALPPVFLRGPGGVIPSAGGLGGNTERFVQVKRTPRKKAKRPKRTTSSPYGTTHL